jgi:hypothetical protein
MCVAYQILRLEAIAQPVAIDHVLRLIKKRVIYAIYQGIKLVTLGRA